MSDLDILNELSELDVRDNGLKKAVVSIPEEIAELNEKLENTENRIEEINSEIEDIEKDLRKSERELEDLNIHLERYNQQIMEVKTNKEYHSIQTEIETAKKGINDTEEIIIELMDRMGYIETERGDIKREFDNERAPLLEKVARFRNELNDIEVRQIEVTEKRKRAIERLSPQMRGEYERIHNRYNGEAVVPLINGTCKGCFVNVPPQVIERLYRGGAIIRCDSCGRFLYTSEEYR